MTTEVLERTKPEIIWPETKKRILVDVDGVIAQYDLVDMIQRKFHVRIDPTNIFTYNLADVLGVPSSAISDMFYEHVWDPPTFIKGAIETLAEWETKYGVVIYSSRVRYMGYDGLARWLIDYGVPFSGINAGQGEYDYHIDDRPEKLCSTNSKIKLLFTQPWNLLCMNIENNLTRVNSWHEIREIVG